MKNALPEVKYYFWKAPINGLPEINSGGHYIQVIPGLWQWVLLHPTSNKIPADAISADEVFNFLERLSRMKK